VVASAVPSVFTHQGRLLDTAGTPLDGAQTVEIGLFPTTTSSSAVWSEPHPVTLSDGYYAVVLGADFANPLDLADFDVDSLYVGVSVGGLPLGGRSVLTAVPFALRASVADSVDGGVVVASEVQVGGQVVIESTGTVPIARVSGAQARVTGTCASGSAVTAVNVDGSVVCAAAGGGGQASEVDLAVNITLPSQTTIVSGWRGLSLSGVSTGSGVSTVGSQLLFDEPGVYRISLDYRGGTGTDVWTGVRLFGDGTTRGAAAGYGVTGGGSSNMMGGTFLASVSNVAVPYEIQLGRLGSSQAIVQPPTVNGQAMAALGATVERVGSLSGGSSFADLRAPAQTFPGNAWTAIAFDSVSMAAGLNIGSGGTVTFSESGPMQFDATYRVGPGADVWTSVGLFSGSAVVAKSVGYGNVPNSHEVFRASFIADVVAGTPYTVRIGRLTSSFATDNPRAIGTESLPSINVVAVPVDPAAHAQIEGDGQTFAGNGWHPVTFSGTSVQSGIAVSGIDITFSSPGVYRLGLSYRNGSGANAWSGVRLVDDVGSVRGVSAGMANDVSTPHLQAVQFLVDVTDISAPHRLEFGRLGNNPLTVASTTPIEGISLSAVVLTATRVQAP
jgi:hypothetical protein